MEMVRADDGIRIDTQSQLIALIMNALSPLIRQRLQISPHFEDKRFWLASAWSFVFRRATK